MALIGDSSTVARHPFLCRLVHYLSTHGELRSALDYGAGPSLVQPMNISGAGCAAPARREPADEAQVESALRSTLQAFLADAATGRLRLGADLTSFERMVAHRLCEEMGIDHESVGDGRKRRLILSKAGWEPPKPVAEGRDGSGGGGKLAERAGAAGAAVRAAEVAAESGAGVGAEAGVLGAEAEAAEVFADGQGEQSNQVVLEDTAGEERAEAPTPTPPRPATNPSSPSSSALPDGCADPTPLAQMLASPPLLAAITAARRDPTQLRPLLLELSRTHPHLVLLIQSHQRDFQSLLTQQLPPGAASLAPAEAPAAPLAAAPAPHPASAPPHQTGAAPIGSRAAAAGGGGGSAGGGGGGLDLRALHAERAERQRAAAAAEAVGVSADAARQSEAGEQERRATRAVKKAKRKAKKKGGEAGGGVQEEEEEEDLDALLARFGTADEGGSSQQASSALPWSRDREEEARRARLRSVLHEKIESGESHKRAVQPKSKKGTAGGAGGGHVFRRGDGVG